MRDSPVKADNVGDTLTAGEFNATQKEIEGLVTNTGQTLDPVAGPDTDTDMVGKAVRHYASSGNSFTVGGTVDAVTLSTKGTLKTLTSIGYFDGMTCAFTPAGTNTGVVTVNVDTIGVKSLVYSSGKELRAGDLQIATIVTAVYRSSLGKFVAISLSGRPEINVVMHGATGDGATDDTAAINAAIAATPSGGTLFFPRPTVNYKIVSTITLAAPIIISGDMSEMKQVTGGGGCFTVTSSDVEIRGMVLTGPQFAAYSSNERGINVPGANVAGYLSNLKVHGNTISSFGGYGIHMDFADDFNISDNMVHSIHHAGIQGLETVKGVINRNTVKDITGSSATQYGIVFSRQDILSLVTNPKPADIVVSGNIVDNVTNWEGIDVHGGERITMINNVVTNCKAGIVATLVNGGGNPIYATTEVNIIGNVVDSGSSAGDKGIGIQVAGANDGVPTIAEYATGVISGNTVKRHGTNGSPVSGGISVQATKGLVISGNSIIECSPNGIHMRYLNNGFSVTGNVIIDPWSGSTDGIGIFIDAIENVGNISGNSFKKESKAAANVLTRGIQVSNSTGTRVDVGKNTNESPIYISDVGQRSLRGNQNTSQSTVGTGVQDLQTTTIPGASIGTGQYLKMIAAGTIAGTNGTKTIRFNFGSVSTIVHPADNLPNGAEWRFEALLEVTGITAQKMTWTMTSETAGLVSLHHGYTTFSEAIAGDIIAKMRGNCANAGDTISQLMWYMEKI